MELVNLFFIILFQMQATHLSPAKGNKEASNIHKYTKYFIFSDLIHNLYISI